MPSREKIARATLSRVLSWSKRLTSWKLRAMPSSIFRWMDAAVMSASSRTMRPESAGISPLMRLTSVVLPAPFEPMRASTSPAVTVKSTWSTAWVSPKDFVSLSVLKHAHDAAALRKRGTRRIAVPTMPAGRARTSTTSTTPSTICQYTVWPTAYVSR